MFKTLLNIFRVPELRAKVLFTLFMLVIYRVGFHVPIPGVDQEQLAEQANPGSREVKRAEVVLASRQKDLADIDQVVAAHPTDRQALATQDLRKRGVSDAEQALANARRSKQQKQKGNEG